MIPPFWGRKTKCAVSLRMSWLDRYLNFVRCQCHVLVYSLVELLESSKLVSNAQAWNLSISESLILGVFLWTTATCAIPLRHLPSSFPFFVFLGGRGVGSALFQRGRGGIYFISFDPFGWNMGNWQWFFKIFSKTWRVLIIISMHKSFPFFYVSFLLRETPPKRIPPICFLGSSLQTVHSKWPLPWCSKEMPPRLMYRSVWFSLYHRIKFYISSET